MSKRRVNLPPLVLDGEAKVLHKMNLRELHLCLTRALRAVGSDSVEESGRSVFSIMEQPHWWPQELPFDAKFTQKLPPEERSVYYRHLLNACYSHYKQEDTLHLFDSRPGEPPRWRLVQDGDNYTIVSTYTDRPIWTYSTNYQILPLITLAAKQTEQYRASIGERLKRSRSDARELVIRTRSQKANPPRQTGDIDLAAFDSGDEVDGVHRFDDISGDRMSPHYRMLLSPDGSPRKFSIMNRLTLANRFSLSELCGEQAEVEQPLPELRCLQCSSGFSTRSGLLLHLIRVHRKSISGKSNADTQKVIKKDTSLYRGVKLVPRGIRNDYKDALNEYVPKASPVLKFWKPQFVGCQLPLSSELGLRLFGAGKVNAGESVETDALSYELYCSTRSSQSATETDVSPDQNEAEEGLSSKCPQNNESSAQNEEDQPTAGDETIQDNEASAAISVVRTEEDEPPKVPAYAKFYPVVYRPPRLIFHTHTYKFTMAERRLFARMQRNGGLNASARKLLENCVPLTVDIVKLTQDDLAKYGIPFDYSDEESECSSEASGFGVTSSSQRSPRSLYRTKSSHTTRAPIVTRSQNQQVASAARALAMVRKKYWSNNVHLMKRIGGVMDNQSAVEKRQYRGRRRRSRRGLVPRRRFSLVEEFDGTDGSAQDYVATSYSLPSSPQKTGWRGRMDNGNHLNIGKRKPFSTFLKMSPWKGRPRREHRLPARYRSSDSSDDEIGNHQKQKKKLPSSATGSPNKLLIRVSPQKSSYPALHSTVNFNQQQLVSLLAKSMKNHYPEPAPVESPAPAMGTAVVSRKAPIRPLSVILPKDAPKPVEGRKPLPAHQQPHAPPPYSMTTCEHVYANLGGYYNFNTEPPPVAPKGFGRFMAPRPLSPATEERIRETVHDVVETACADLRGKDLPAEVTGLRFDDGNPVGVYDSNFTSVKQEVDDEASRSSESTIVSAIYEVPSSPEEDDDKEDEPDSKWDIAPPIPVLQQHQQMESDEELPAAKRLKMSFSEICAFPQKLWNRPSILSARKPTILGGRPAVPSVAAADTLKSDTAQANGPSAVTSGRLEQGKDSGRVQEAAWNGNGGKGTNQVVENHQQGPENAMVNCTANPDLSVAGNETPAPRSTPMIIIPSTSSCTAPIATTSVQQLPNFSHLVGKTFRVPPGCRLVAIPVKNIASGAGPQPSTASSTAVVQGATYTPIAPKSTSGSQPTRTRVLLPGVSSSSSPAVAPVVPASVAAADAPSPQILSSSAASNTSFRCGFCGVELLFATHWAWQNIQYHMSVAHKNRNYKLRKVVRKRPSTTMIIEAVGV